MKQSPGVDPCNRKVVHVIVQDGRNVFSYNRGFDCDCFTANELLVADALRSYAPAKFDIAVFRDGKVTPHDYGTYALNDKGEATITGFIVLFPDRIGRACSCLPAVDFAAHDRIEIGLPENFK